MVKTPSTQPAVSASPRALLALIIVAALAAVLGIYQWVEMVNVRTGEGTPLCSFSATFDCTGVWNSALSHAVHRSTGLPIAGWGLAWSLIVLVLAAWLFYLTSRARAAQASAADAGHVVWALRISVVVGVLATLVLLAYSMTIKIFCPTCILFYLFVAIIAYLVFARLRAPTGDWLQPALLSAGLLLVTFAVLLYPGLHTPRENLITAKLSSVSDDPALRASAAESASDANASELEKFLNSLPLSVQQATSNSLAIYRKSPLVKAPVDAERLTFGSASSPVHLIEWTDIRCPHCKSLESALAEIRAISPPNSWSQETRHFPLDSECNTKVERSAGGISCLAAKVQICLLGSPDLPRVRTSLFDEQAKLSKERIWQIAAPDAARRKNLEDCVSSPATQAALQEDIELADKYQIDGTPLVVINERKATAVPAAILGLIMARGRDDDPGFLVLPAPSLGSNNLQ